MAITNDLDKTLNLDTIEQDKHVHDDETQMTHT